MLRFTITLIAALMLTGTGVYAAGRLPQKFVGMWCHASGSAEDPSSTYRRAKHCEWAEDEYFIMTPDRFAVAQEVSCKVIKVEAMTRPEMYKVKIQCRHLTGETWEDSNWMAIERGRLIITGTNEDGAPKK
jgi:hypothetical protein